MAEAAVLAYVGHLLVVGGRAVRVPPPGALAESAPRRASRAREGDTFFILVTPHGDTHAPAPVYEALAQFATDVYFGSSGGITGGLREALTAINTQLLTQHDGLRVGAIALAQRGAELYAARSGRTFAALLQWPELALFPNDRRDPLIMNLRPLGADTTPDIQLARYTVAPGQALLLADASLIARSDDDLRSALSAENVAAITERVKALAGNQTAASVIRFAAPEAPDTTGMVALPSERAPRTAPSPPAPVPPRPSTQTQPPRESQPPQPAAPADITADLPRRPAERPVPGDSAPRTSSVTGTPGDTVAPFTPEQAANRAQDTVPDRGPGHRPDTELLSMQDSSTRAASGLVDSAAPPFPPEEAAALVAQADADGAPPGAANPLLARAQAVFGRLRPDATGEADAVTSRSRSTGLRHSLRRARRQVRHGLRNLLAMLLAVINGITAAFDRLLPAPGEDGKQGIPTNVAIGMAVLIPFVIVIVVVGLALSEQGKGEFQVYLDRARTAHQEALDLANGTCDNVALRPLWVEVLRLAEQAGEYRPNDQDVLVISADARNYLDCFDKVERRDVKLLHEFDAGAELAGPIINGGVDLYTLDRARGRIYHDTLNESGSDLTTRSSSPIIWTGQVISNATGNFTVGELIDIEWLTAGGTAHDNVLIALDRQGQLLAYSPTFFASAQQLVIEGRWVRPVALAVFRSNIYVLDAGANQIWRYVPPAGVRAYPNAPEEYFNGDTLPDLATAVDFGISDNGAVYVLFADGTIKRYRRNTQAIVEEQPFELHENPPGALVSGVALFVDNDPLSQQLYIVDPETDAIYETLWGGKFRRGYRPRNVTQAFDNVSGIYADAVVRNNMYVVAGNKLFQFKRNP